ncbi:Transposon Ty3-I Gag-Pol polyprotein, partial [Araneus ventricosus]
PNDKDFNEKAKLIEEKLSLNEPITITNLLLINSEGTKKDIVLRLLTYICDLNILNQNIIRENDSGSDSENEKEQYHKSYENLSEESVQLQVHNVSQPNISFNDVESIIMPFNGDSHQSIEKWIELFEDVNMFNLSDLHKLVFGKRSLKGKAKLYMQSETDVNSWEKLKDLLLSEFGYSCNSAELHEMLSKRKLKDDESLEEYCLKMKQLCTRGNVEDTALMQYVINGIPDSVFRKSILYGSQNLSEFKQKLRVYDKMIFDYDKVKPNKPKFGNETKDRIKAPKIENKDKFKDTKLNNIRCFNCGALGHKSSVCENKIKGLKCLRRFPIIEKEIINEQIEQYLKDKIIRPSTSEYSSPVVLVKKKDGSSRLCIDYRRLNKITVREHFPLPLIDDLLDRLQSAKLFTTLDLRNAFFHVDIDPSSKKYTSFVTDTGQYEFNKMSFGLTNSPSVFQRYIYNVFRDLIKENVVMIYLHDLVISSENESQGIERLQRVLKTASEYGLELNIKKCQFLKREIEFLGHRIKDGKLYDSPLKIKAVMKFPEPTCTKDIKSYLGLTGYFRKFIPHY